MRLHIIIKNSETYLLPVVRDMFKQAFIVEEVGDLEGLHWHCLVETELSEKTVRRQIDKHRPNKCKGISFRKWDENVIYLCKGASPGEQPIIIKQTLPDVDDDLIKRLHDEWWVKCFNNPNKNPDIKHPKVLDILVEQCRDHDLTEEEVIQLYIDIVVQGGGLKSFANRNVGQSYIRTALCFTSKGPFFRAKMKKFYRYQLW